MLYSDRQINLVKDAGKVIRLCLEAIKKELRPGVTTKQLDSLVFEMIKQNDSEPAFLNYQQGKHDPYPASICASVNDVVIHGIPDDRPLVDGDLLSIDIGVKKSHYYADAAWTYAIGNLDEQGQKLLNCGEESLNRALSVIKPKALLSDIGRSVQGYVESCGFFVVRDFVGHGVGLNLHEEPQVKNYYDPEEEGFKDMKLRAGMILAVEPMITERTPLVKFSSTDWIVKTEDGSRSVHFEHTVVIRESGIEILT